MRHHDEHPRTLRRLGARLACAVVVPVLVTLAGWGAAPASAHDDVVASEPAEAGLVETLPSRAVLSFSGPISEVHAISVMGPDGSVVNGSATYSGTEVRQNLWAGPDGEYTLTYDVVSADGHEVAGEIHFEVGPTSVAPSESTSSTAAPRPGFWERRSSAVVPVSLVVLAGAAAVVVVRRTRLRRQPDQRPRRAHR
jgi:methionine-rich copper-binding protein CopC